MALSALANVGNFEPFTLNYDLIPTYPGLDVGSTTSPYELGVFKSIALENPIQGATAQVIHQASTSTTDYKVVWPTVQGYAGSNIVNNGTGSLSWGGGTGVTGGYIVNGGNAFGVPTSVGTLDNNSFSLITNGVTAVSIGTNGNVSFVSQISSGTNGGTGGKMTLNGANSGSIGISPGATTTSYNLILPSVQGATGSYISNDGTGNLSWLALSGTANQVNISSNSTTTTFSLPQSIATTSNPTFSTVILNTRVLTPIVDSSIISTLSLGPANTTGIIIGRAGITTTIPTTVNMSNLTASLPLQLDSSKNIITSAANLVTSITGTANQVIASSSTGNITLSTPQDIASTSFVNFGSITLTDETITNPVFSNVVGGATLTTSGFRMRSTANLIPSWYMTHCIEKIGYEKLFLGINKDSTTVNVPANSLFLSTYNTNGQISFGRGDGSGGLSSSDILITGTGLVNMPNGLNLGGLTASLPLQLDGSKNVVSTAITLSGSQVTGTLPVANGGTNQTTYTNGQLLIGNTTGNTLTKSTLTGTSNQVVVTNGTGSITLSTPQDINTSSRPTFIGGIYSGSSSTTDILTLGAATNTATSSPTAINVSATFAPTATVSNNVISLNIFGTVNLTSTNTVSAYYGQFIQSGTFNLASGSITNSYGFRVDRPNHSSGNQYTACFMGKNGTSGALVGIDTTSPTHTLQLGNDDAAKTVTTLWTVTSDQRIKTNITDYSGATAIAKINGIKVRTFDYIPEYKSQYGITMSGKIGVIAQELETVMPSCVYTESGSVTFGSGATGATGVSISGLKSVNMDQVNYMLIAAVQNLSARLAAVESAMLSLNIHL